MTPPSAGRESGSDNAEETSLLALATVLLRWRRMILGLALLGGILGATIGLLSKRVYQSFATFIPQTSDANVSGLALAASQFGITVPGMTGGGWGTPIYVVLLQSRALLEPLALDTVTLGEEGGRRVPLMDLLEVRGPTPARRLDKAIRKLNRIAVVNEDRRLGAVTLTVRTQWPSVSLDLARRLVNLVNEFNVQSRRSQAAAERQFVEARAAEAEQALRTAEDRLQSFLQRNRSYATSSELSFQHDRLERDVTHRQQLYTALLQSQEEARIREVRDTPVITILQEPRLPAAPASRGVALKVVLGVLGGGLLGTLTAFLAHGMAVARQRPTAEAKEFVDLVEAATPRFLRRPG